ncbi:hypothetical protein L3Y34_013203 [Caenorhabditis briggsae]|uniref:Nuclear receptor domain-containing protein n=1 Tax=Caenorhabditis briggsae TaxID=6238 RepID=A0AAE9A0P8_CAEBR|nr:hypothetical protein L3Y34_013203 [Caenorhabditis briggsae]
MNLHTFLTVKGHMEFRVNSLEATHTRPKLSTSSSGLCSELLILTLTKLEPHYDQYYDPSYDSHLYHHSVAPDMYNTRRSAYLNSCSTAMELAPQSMHQNWRDTEYNNTNGGNNELDLSDMPMFGNDKDDPFYDDNGGSGSGEEQSTVKEKGGNKKSTRKRANTTSSNGGNEKTESKRTANKVCRVCGDKAFSYNFNVITCESCKAFFRRNANKEKEIRCPFNEQCEINMVSRRFCQRCRLTKCFSVGMKKEWIMSEEARLEKKQRVEENREKRMLDAIKNENENSQGQSQQQQHMQQDENMYDDSPNSNEMSVRQFLANEENIHIPPLPHNMGNDMGMHYYQDGPSDIGYSNDYDYPMNQCPSSGNNPMDLIDNFGATTIADNGSSPPNKSAVASAAAPPQLPAQPMMDMESKPLAPNVLFSASMSAIKDVAAIMSNGESNNLGMVPTDVVNENLLNVAQAAVQAQAIVNHTQQLAAAVVAQQVAAIAPVIPTVSPLDPLLTPALISAPAIATPLAPAITAPINAPITAALAAPIVPPMQVPTLPTPMNPGIPIIPKEMPVSVNLLNQLEQTPSEMVTVPKDMLMRLIQNNSRTQACTCTCMCGRYPPGSCIVDEVTKDLMNGGSSNSSNATERDQASLETTEDMQMNGLLPGDANSSITWLSQQSSAQNVVDPITHSMSAEEAHNQRERRDSIFGAYSMAETVEPSQPKSVQEETFWEHTIAENESRELSEEEVEKMEELTEISNCWMSAGLDNLPILELFTEKNVSIIVNGLKLLSSFRFLPKQDKRTVIKRGIFHYCVVKWMQHKETMFLEKLNDRQKDDFMDLINREEFNYRIQPGAFNTLAISVLFHSGAAKPISTEVYMEHLLFKKLLDKNLPIKVSSNTVFNSYYPAIEKAAGHLIKLTGGISDRLVRYAVS